MKLAISGEERDESSKVSDVGGRAPYYHIYEDGEHEVIKNPYAKARGGAGRKLPGFFEEKGIELVISGHFGINMQRSLEEKGIRYKEVEIMTVKDAKAQT